MDKSYCSFTDSITANELYEGLLAYGFFADKLPPVFTSVPFYTYCIRNNPVFNSEWHDFISFISMRNINIPRVLGIPTPMKYQKLCSSLRDNWPSIQSHFHRTTDGQNYRISRIHIRKQKKSKSLFEMNYKNWRTDGNPETDLLIHNNSISKYLVEADISTCFPSIYTHSIPWALVGKDVAKSTHGDNTYWYNQIDAACYEMRNGETHGLLIGPHSSNLLSEIILTSVDKILYDKGYRYYRNIDDYDCFVSTYEEAQLFLKDLEETLRLFDLPLNHKKTRILELPVANTESWVHKLNSMQLLTQYGKASYKEVNSYLDLSLQLSDKENNSAVLKYAIKVLSKLDMTANAKALAAKRIMHLAALNPYLLQLMDEYVFMPYGVEQEQIKAFADSIFQEAKRVNNYEAICYAIFFAIKYGFWLNEEFYQWAIDRGDCVTLVMTWLYYLKACHGNKKATLVKRIKAEAKRLKGYDMDRYWLFCYEVLSAEDLDGEWKDIKKANISFIIPELITA